MADDTKILMTVPKDVIDAQVRAAVMVALNKDPEALVRAVVEAAMSQKKDHYSTQTIWMEQLNQMIRDVAKDEFKAWVEAQRPSIAKMIKAKLGDSTKGLVDKLSTKMAEGLTGVHFNISWPER